MTRSLKTRSPIALAIAGVGILLSVATSQVAYSIDDTVEMGALTVNAESLLRVEGTVSTRDVPPASDVWVEVQLIIEGQNTTLDSGELQVYVVGEEELGPVDIAQVRGAVDDQPEQVFAGLSVPLRDGSFAVRLELEGGAEVVGELDIVASLWSVEGFAEDTAITVDAELIEAIEDAGDDADGGL